MPLQPCRSLNGFQTIISKQITTGVFAFKNEKGPIFRCKNLKKDSINLLKLSPKKLHPCQQPFHKDNNLSHYFTLKFHSLRLSSDYYCYSYFPLIVIVKLDCFVLLNYYASGLELYPDVVKKDIIIVFLLNPFHTFCIYIIYGQEQFYKIMQKIKTSLLNDKSPRALSMKVG